MERGHAPVVAAARRLVRAGERRTDHHRVRTAGDGLGDIAAGAHPAVGDHVDVHAGLVEVADPRARGVGDRGRLRNPDAEHTPRRARVTGTDADEHADRARAHEVQRGAVRRAPADDHRDLELTDELLEVERLASRVLGHVLGGDDRALHDEEVQLGLEHRRGELLDPLRASAMRRRVPRRP